MREGRRLTTRGNGAGAASFTGNCGTLGKPSLIYLREDSDSVGGFYEIALDGSEPEGKLRARASGQQLSFAPDCSFLFDDSAISERRYSFQDLFRQLPSTSSRDSTVRRLTTAAAGRAATDDPSTNPSSAVARLRAVMIVGVYDERIRPTQCS